MRVFLMMMAAVFAVLIGIAPVAAQTYPKLTGLVVDAANVLPPATEADLTAKLEALQKDTKRQLIVATIPDLQGRELEEYGVGLGRAWGAGLKGVNNGAILFVAPNEAKGHRGPRLEVGYGLEPILTDAWSGTMLREKMVPVLNQSQDIPAAMEAGTDALITQLRASPEEAKTNVDAAATAFDRTHRRAPAHNGGGIPFGLVFWGIVIAFVLLSAMRRRGAGGQRYRGGISPVVLWGSGFGSGWGTGSGGGSFGGFGGGGSGGGSDGSWGGGGFTGGGGGSFGGGGASGDW